MTVYTIVKQANHDFTTASEFGELNVLFPLGVNIVDVKIIADAAREFFSDFDFDNDYFLPVGSPIVVAVVCICLSEEFELQQKESISFLEWDKYRQSYSVKTYDASDENDDK